MAGKVFNSSAMPLGGNPTVSSTIKETSTSNTKQQQKPAPDQSWGDRREFLLDSEDATIRFYLQNANGLFGKETGLNTAFHQIWSAGVTIFVFKKPIKIN